MRVVTWNVWWRFGPWEQRQPALTAVLRSLDPDVVCLQEVWATADGHQAEILGAALGLHVAAVPHAGPEREGGDSVSTSNTSFDSASFDSAPFDSASFGNAVLSRWPIVEHEVVPLPLADGRPGHRHVVAAVVDAPHGPTTVMSTHLEYPFDQSALRSRQVTALCELVADRRADDPRSAFPPILCGDFNAVPDSDEMRSLTGQAPPPVPGLVFTDAWAAAGDGPGWTWDDRNPHLADTSWPRRRLDYVLVGWPRPKPVGNPVRARIAGAGRHNGVWPSDHLAVCVDLETQENP